MPTRQELIDEIPTHRGPLRAFAISLSGNGDRADDLVQETFMRAIANIDSFDPGTNMPAWLFTILRNIFRSDYRKRRREVEDVDGSYQKTLKTQPDQIDKLHMNDFRDALAKIPADQRDALLLIAVYGYSYNEAALICGVAEGTIKSRLFRARQRLLELIPEEDSVLLAAFSAEGRAPMTVDA